MALGAGALAGGLSIPHCVAMCGPLAAFAAGEKGSWRRIARYQLGRLGSYVALGIAAGSSGGALASLVAPRWAAIALSFFLAAAMVLAAVRLLGPGEARLVQLGRRRPGTPWIARLLARLPREPALVGAVTALLPCGALYSAALVAAGTGAWHSGALAMGAFALGSGVGLASSAFFGQRARVSARGRRVLALALLAGALVLVLRPLMASEGPPPCHGPAHAAASY